MKPMNPLNAIGLAIALAVPLAIGLVFLLPVVAPTFYAEYIAEPEPDASIWPDTYFPTFAECVGAKPEDGDEDTGTARSAIRAYKYLVEAADWPSFEELDTSANYIIESINGYSLGRIKFMAYEYCTHCYSIASCAVDSDRLKSKFTYLVKETKNAIKETCDILETETELLPKLTSPEGCKNAIDKYDLRRSREDKPSIVKEGE